MATSFLYRFKTLGLGKVIGKRTWGGHRNRESLPLVMVDNSF